MKMLVDLSDMDDLECPVCLNQLTPPVVQCNNGHNTCSKCKLLCQHCPICRGHFLSTPNRVLDQILQKLPQPCRYSELGCRFRVSDIHQAHFCKFRPIECQLGQERRCPWSGTVEDWLDHAPRQHRELELEIGSTTLVYMFDYNLFKNYASKSSKLKVKDNHFVLNIRKVYKILSITITYVPTQKRTEDFFFQICFKDSNGEIMNKTTLMPTVFTDNQDEEDDMSMDILLSNLEYIRDNRNQVLAYFLVETKKRLMPKKKTK